MRRTPKIAATATTPEMQRVNAPTSALTPTTIPGIASGISRDHQHAPERQVSRVCGFSGDTVVCVVESFTHEACEVAVGQAVDDVAAVLSRLHHADESQFREMLTDRGPGGGGLGGKSVTSADPWLRIHRRCSLVGSDSIRKVSPAASSRARSGCSG